MGNENSGVHHCLRDYIYTKFGGGRLNYNGETLGQTWVGSVIFW